MSHPDIEQLKFLVEDLFSELMKAGLEETDDGGCVFYALQDCWEHYHSLVGSGSCCTSTLYEAVSCGVRKGYLANSDGRALIPRRLARGGYAELVELRKKQAAEKQAKKSV
jgi:hypothetical protein